MDLMYKKGNCFAQNGFKQIILNLNSFFRKKECDGLKIYNVVQICHNNRLLNRNPLKRFLSIKLRCGLPENFTSI